jgi:cytosine/adenosine deaminase-related metal-dependent hydrolase
MDDVVIRGGHVVTMESVDVPGGDVHVRNGRIAAVGPALEAPGATVIDARGMIVMPGFVETHWHMWNALLRSMSDKGGYFRLIADAGRTFGPEETYYGTRLACAEAAYSGITTVHDWAHNVRSPEHAAASLQALQESGLRARYSYGWPAGLPNDQAMDLADLSRLRAEWSHPQISLGMAWRGPGGSNPAVRVPPEIYSKEIEVARDLGLPVTVHASGPRSAAGQIRAIADLLGPDVQVVHGNAASSEEISILAATGANVSVSPVTELRIGYGLPRTGEFVAAGIPTGLSIDTTVLSGSADMFEIMKLVQMLENGASEDEFAWSARKALELATIEGARALGLESQIGTIRPGKRADLIIINPNTPNIGVLTDPAHLLVTAAQPVNVDTVMVEGRLLKHGGRMDVSDVIAGSRAAFGRVTARFRPR